MNTLEKFTNDLDISKLMRERAKEIYEELSLVLQKELEQYDPEIFVQGSFRTNTIIKPLIKKEYDLDFVCLLKDKIINLNPIKLKSLLGNILKKKYSNKLEEKKRCWCINFDNFHVDILPALPLSIEEKIIFNEIDEKFISNPIKIPDKQLSTFTTSNPKGLAKWFEEQSLKTNILRKSNCLEKNIEKFPSEYKGKSVLQKIVQILKRHRDFMFQKNSKNKPISVIITTLAGTYYNGEQTLVSALKNIIKNIPISIDNNYIPNPVHPQENFADKWKEKPERKEAFNDWLLALNKLIIELEEYSNNYSPLLNMENILARHFKSKKSFHINKIEIEKNPIQPWTK